VEEGRIRTEIAEVGRRLYARGLISANEGNLSVREGDLLFVTPAGVCKGFLEPGMIVRTDLSGRPLDPGARPTTELPMHVALYRHRPDARAVVHAHPPTATGFAVAGIPLDQPVVAEAVAVLGRVPLVPYDTPASPELAERVAEAAREADALLLASHGATTLGDSLARAWERMETLEQVARVMLIARLLGGEKVLPLDAVYRLVGMGAAAWMPVTGR
jgi:L-fuculose-phosphate aldolase